MDKPTAACKSENKILNLHGVKVEVAKTAGFCFGVNRAVQMTKELAQKNKVATLGPLIHNPQVVQELEKQGVIAVTKPNEVPKGSVAVIRSHGVAPEVIKTLCENETKFVDATCPFVKKIHNIANEAFEKGAFLLIAGDENHPEVQGIVGHARGRVLVFFSAQNLIDNMAKIPPNMDVWVVAQTTFEVTKWLESVKILKKVCTKCSIFDTICSATWARQQEVEELALNNNLVVVVGGKKSSNTRKLLNVAAAHTRAVQIEKASELWAVSFNGVKAIGVTAGASTPSSAIEEVLTIMSDVILDGEKTFEEMLEESMKPVYAGLVVTGVVDAVSANEITVDIGTKHTGIVKLEELTDDPTVRSAADVVKRDDEMELVVIKVSDQDGIVYLSKRQMEARKGAAEVSQAAEDGTVMDGYVIESNKGGLVANVKGVKVFIPASQAAVRRGEDYTALVRTHVKLKIKEFSPRRTIGSIRDVLAAEQAAMREKFWSDVEVGKHFIGVVKSLTNYGAFVDIGGVDGLVHISELSWSRIKHPSEIVSLGDSIEVYVKDLDTEKHKVSLGFKKKEDDPWAKLKNNYPEGSEFTATVVSLTQFGAFVRILPGIDGLVHISEISHDRVEKVADALSVGQEVQVKMLDVDFDRKRISLSIKALIEKPEKPEERADGGVVASASEEETVVAPEVEAEMESEEN